MRKSPEKYIGALHMAQRTQRPWHAIAQEAQKYRDKTLTKIMPSISDVGIPQKSSANVLESLRTRLSMREVEITELPVKSLLEQLRAGRLTAITVVEAFLRRAAMAQQLV